MPSIRTGDEPGGHAILDQLRFRRKICEPVIVYTEVEVFVHEQAAQLHADKFGSVGKIADVLDEAVTFLHAIGAWKLVVGDDERIGLASTKTGPETSIDDVVRENALHSIIVAVRLEVQDPNTGAVRDIQHWAGERIV